MKPTYITVLIITSFFLRGCDLFLGSAFCVASEPFTIFTLTNYTFDGNSISRVYSSDFSAEPTNFTLDYYIDEYEFATDRSVLIHPGSISDYKTLMHGAYPQLLSNYQTLRNSLPRSYLLESLDIRLANKEATYTTLDRKYIQHPSVDELNIRIDHHILSYQNIARNSLDTLYFEKSRFLGDYSFVKSNVYNALVGEDEIYALLNNEYFNADSGHTNLTEDSFNKTKELNHIIRYSLSNQKLDTILVIEPSLPAGFKFKITKDYVLVLSNNLSSIYSLSGSLIHEISNVGQVKVNFSANDFTYKNNGKFYHFDIDKRRRYPLSRYSDNINSAYPGNNRTAIISNDSQKIVVADLGKEQISETINMSSFLDSDNEELDYLYLYPVFDDMNTLSFLVNKTGITGGVCAE